MIYGNSFQFGIIPIFLCDYPGIFIHGGSAGNDRNFYFVGIEGRRVSGRKRKSMILQYPQPDSNEPELQVVDLFHFLCFAIGKKVLCFCLFMV